MHRVRVACRTPVLAGWATGCATASCCAMLSTHITPLNPTPAPSCPPPLLQAALDQQVPAAVLERLLPKRFKQYQKGISGRA